MELKIREETYDKWTQREISRNLYGRYFDFRSDDIVLDLGGHIGLFSASISNKVKEIISFEADLDNYNLYLENINRNEIKNVTIINKAVIGTDEKNKIFYINQKRNKGAHSFYVKRGRVESSVQCVNINSVLDEYFPNVIKMDIEGEEYSILKNICPEKFSIFNRLVFEYHFSVLKDRDYSKYFEIINILKDKFTNLVYSKDPKKNWYTIVYAWR